MKESTMLSCCNDIEPAEGTELADWRASAQLYRQTPRVWLVDDSDELRHLLARLLADEGSLDCSRDFASPQAVLEALDVGPSPDLILMDVQMGPDCGLDFIKPIRARACRTHVLMLTTCFDRRREVCARQNGASDYLLKSYPLEELVQRIWKALALPVPVVAAPGGIAAEEKEPFQSGWVQDGPADVTRSRCGAPDSGGCRGGISRWDEIVSRLRGWFVRAGN